MLIVLNNSFIKLFIYYKQLTTDETFQITKNDDRTICLDRSFLFITVQRNSNCPSSDQPSSDIQIIPTLDYCNGGIQKKNTMRAIQFPPNRTEQKCEKGKRVVYALLYKSLEAAIKRGEKVNSSLLTNHKKSKLFKWIYFV